MKAKLKQSILKSLDLIDPSDRPEVYGISLYIDCQNDDPRLPTLTVGYNTKSYWKSMVPEASDPSEAKWNYAFWLQNSVLEFGCPPLPSARLVQEWIGSNSLGYTNSEEDEDWERCEDLGAKITSGFVDLVVAAASELQQSSVVEDFFGGPVPLIIHELEYYSEIANQNRRANPNGEARGFVRWVESL